MGESEVSGDTDVVGDGGMDGDEVEYGVEEV
jgi:hypothetical protein